MAGNTSPDRVLHRTLTRQLAIDTILAPEKDIKAQSFAHQRVLLRADLNVPFDKKRRVITDSTRISAVLPTIELLQKQGAKTIICSHFGRPEPGKQTEDEMRAQYSLAPVADELRKRLGPAFVGMTSSCIGPEVAARVASLQDGQVLLLENTRFHAGDTDNTTQFSRELADSYDAFVNDAFGALHRDQGSVTGVTRFLKRCMPGLLVRKEVQCLADAIDAPRRPFVVILGGAKVVDKLHLVDIMIEKADKIIIGGKMAFTFLQAQGVQLGKTDIEEEHRVQDARAMEEKATKAGKPVLLPVDAVIATDLKPGVPTSVAALTNGSDKAAPCIPEGYHGYDIGPETVKLFSEALADCQTVFWNGPLGAFEVADFAKGTEQIAHAVAAATRRGAATIIGGGDSAAAVASAGLSEQDFTHVSTGGGASLELIEGAPMPGLRALTLGVK